MNPQLVAALIPLVIPALGTLGELVLALIDRLQHEDSADSYSRIAYHVVRGIEEAHPEWESDMRRAYAVDAVIQSTGLERATCAALVELAVLRMRQEKNQ